MRTLIGQLILQLKQDFGPQAKEVETAVAGIETSMKRLQSMPWGSSFQRQLEAIKATPNELKAVQQSWAETFGAMKQADLKTALQRADLTDWRNAVIGHLGAVRSEMAAGEKQANSFVAAMKKVGHFGMSMLGYAGGGYLGYELGRGAIAAGAKRGHERFLEQQSGLFSNVDQMALGAKSLSLSQQYPVSATDIMALGRVATGTFGIGSGMANLETMVQAQSILDNLEPGAHDKLTPLLRSGDLLNMTKQTTSGTSEFRSYIDGMIRAAQADPLFNPATMLQFAQRAKISRLALDPSFIENVVPTLGVDMNASGAGAAMASAFKSFLIGDASINGKKYMGRQRDLGIRDKDNNLVDPDLYGKNPYEWTKQYLIPALVKAGTDMTNPTAVSAAVGKLSANTNATGLLTTMIEQQQFIERQAGNYNKAVGLNSAVGIEGKDPYAAWTGFKNALDNLAAAASDKMNVIIPALNSLTGWINGAAKWVADNPGPTVGAAAAGAGVAGFGIWKSAQGLLGLTRAGPQLQVAATELQAAAAALQGAAGAEAASGAGGVGGGGPRSPKLGAGIATRGLGFLGAAGMYAGAMQDFQNGIRYLKPGEKPPLPVNTGATDQLNAQIANWLSGAWNWASGGASSLGRGAAGALASQFHALPPQSQDPVDRAINGWFDGIFRPSKMINSSGSPDDRDHGLSAVASEAAQAKTALDTVNATTVAPKVDTSGIDAATAKAAKLQETLNGINSWRPHLYGGPLDNARSQLDRSYADHGVEP